MILTGKPSSGNINLVFLPATDPADIRFGKIPGDQDLPAGFRSHGVLFPRMVWYNCEIRRQAIAQISAMKLACKTLVGFSKSGLGAWNIMLSNPADFAATIIFDAPVACEAQEAWAADKFYHDRKEWIADLPIISIAKFKKKVPPDHRLILVSGSLFHRDMEILSRALTDAGADHDFLPRPELEHKWDSGWLGEALAIIRSRQNK